MADEPMSEHARQRSVGKQRIDGIRERYADDPDIAWLLEIFAEVAVEFVVNRALLKTEDDRG